MSVTGTTAGIGLRVEAAGYATVQDLGRPGFAGIGIPVNGAADRRSARTANLLVGNAQDAPLVEITGSRLIVVAEADLLLAVTGATETVVVDGHPQPAWQALTVSAGSRVVVPDPVTGMRTYLAVNGRIQAPRSLNSVSPDPLLGVGTRLSPGHDILLDSRYAAHPQGQYARLFRLDAGKPPRPGTPTVRVTDGPDLTRLVAGRSALASSFTVLPQSDHVGLRLDGPEPEQHPAGEILSRGVPVGAVEVPPSGGLIVLLRGRLVTAGYPVVAVVTSESIDRLGQVRPGDEVRFAFCSIAEAGRRLREQENHLTDLSTRVRGAFAAKGLAAVLDPHLADRPVGGIA